VAQWISNKVDQFTLYGWGIMKYFIDAIAATLAFKETPIHSSIARYLQQHGISMVLYLFAMLLGFDAAVVLQLFAGMYILPLSGICCVSLFFFLFFRRMKITSSFASRRNPHEIDVTDLLEREVVPLETREALAVLQGQVILVTGAAGSIGSELCRQLLDYEPELLIALDMNETGLFDLAEGLRSRSHPHITKLYPYIGDITDVQRMTRLFAEKRPNIVFHAAAYKHVPLLEEYPDLAIRTNVLATYHLCRLAQKYEVARFVCISTDKAAEPVSVMGATKRLGEMIVQSLAESTHGMTRFCAVRFGNVLGSRGSVVPIFAQQIEQGGPLTVTDPEATRYFMTIPEACGLVILTSAIASQGGLYLLNMGHPVQIIDLAEKMIRLCGLRVGQDIAIVHTGLRPGERLHETLVAGNEELTHTANKNILCVRHQGQLPTLTAIDKWVDTIGTCLVHEDVTQLRRHLFEIVGEQVLIGTS
jgi:FlaA1/EpsC-like NDP-sugar epimerase